MNGAHAPDPRLAEAYEACARIVRERARNFWYGLRLTPEPKRSSMYAIYAWMRAADDLADDLVDGSAAGDPSVRRHRLDRFRAATAAALDGQAVDDQPVWVALAATARIHRLVAKDFDDMLDGQLADLGEVCCATWDDLRLVCYRVASTVGLVCIRVWGYSDQRAIEHAIDRGIAFQLTNILRDIREDHAAGRTYLPADELARFGLTPESLIGWRDPARSAEFMRFQCERARAHYEASAPLESMIAPDCVPTLWALTRIYRSLLERIAASPRRVMTARVRVPTWQKLWIGYRARRLAATAGAVAARPEAATP